MPRSHYTPVSRVSSRLASRVSSRLASRVLSRLASRVSSSLASRLVERDTTRNTTRQVLSHITALSLHIGVALSLSLVAPLTLGTPHIWASPTLDTLGALDSLDAFSVGLEAAPSDAYFNPAGLAWSARRTQVGIVGVSQHLALTFDPQPQSTRVSGDIYRAEPIDPNQASSVALPSAEVAPRSLDESASSQAFALFGLTQPLIAHRLSLGVTALLPLHRFELQSPGYADERAQYFERALKFERWGDHLEGMSLSFGLGWRVTSWLGLGAGASFNTRSVAQSDVFLSDASYQGLSLISPRVEVKSSLNPHLSAELRARHIRGFVSVFTPEEVLVEGSSAVKIWNYPYPEGERSLVQRFSQRYRALPWRIRWGGRLDLSGVSSRCSAWSLVHGGQWSQWSSHHNRVGEPSGWRDQLEVSGGARYELDASAFGVDLRWRPTPVPHQIGRDSYVDPSQLALALSGRWRLSDQLSWQVNAQGHWLVPRRDVKSARALNPVRDEFPSSRDEVTGDPIISSVGLQTNNPGFPAYESSGWVWSGGVSLIWSVTPR